MRIFKAIVNGIAVTFGLLLIFVLAMMVDAATDFPDTLWYLAGFGGIVMFVMGLIGVNMAEKDRKDGRK